MTTHVSLDLETWGLRAGYDIRSIGAAVFDPEDWHVDGEGSPRIFYRATENPEIVGPMGIMFRAYKLERDPETVTWWSQQSNEARAAFNAPVDLKAACVAFATWLQAVEPDPKELRIWANDPQFDIAILEAVFYAVGVPVPWIHTAPRSLRTIVEAAGMTKEDYFSYGTAHHALHDAIAQASTICAAHARLRRDTFATPAALEALGKAIHDAQHGLGAWDALIGLDDVSYWRDRAQENLRSARQAITEQRTFAFSGNAFTSNPEA